MDFINDSPHLRDHSLFRAKSSELKARGNSMARDEIPLCEKYLHSRSQFYIFLSRDLPISSPLHCMYFTLVLMGAVWMICNMVCHKLWWLINWEEQIPKQQSPTAKDSTKIIKSPDFHTRPYLEVHSQLAQIFWVAEVMSHWTGESIVVHLTQFVLS